MARVTLLLLALAVLISTVGCTFPVAPPLLPPDPTTPPAVDLSGTWKGQVGQAPYALLQTLEITQKRDGQMTAKLTLSTSDFTRSAVMEVEGVVSGDQLFYHGTRMLKEAAGFCLATVELAYQKTGTRETLDGRFGPLGPFATSSNLRYACPGQSQGVVFMEKQ